MQITSLTKCATGLIAFLAFVASSYAADLTQIGSGQPGLKIATRSPGSIVIYEDEPSTVGVGLMGGMAARKIRVLIDQNYRFSKDRMEIPEQLYPLAPDTVFTSKGGTWTDNLTDGSIRLAPMSDIERAVARSISYLTYRLRPTDYMVFARMMCS